MIARHARSVFFSALFCGALVVFPAAAQSAKRCGDLIELDGHNKTKFVYSLNVPSNASAVLILLPGGPGFADLDKAGCARKLTGNSLIRTQDLFQKEGFATALVDAPSDHRGEDGLGGFRISPLHAEDLGKVIADVRRRTKLPVWIVGTSRGSISAVNAASRLTGENAPDGLVVTSPLTSGNPRGRKSWVAQTVFSVPLEAIKMPVLVVVHAADACIRTPASLGASILARTNGVREQAVTVTGGAKSGTSPTVDACGGSSPHGFLGQEQEVTAGIIRFIRGGNY